MSDDIPDSVYEAAAKAYDEAVNAALGNPPGSVLGEAGRDLWVWHPAFRASTDAAYAAGRAQAAVDIERPGSILCDCDSFDPPTNPTTRTPIDHHCDCQAVRAAATMLGAYSVTVHARQCEHGTEHDEFYLPVDAEVDP